MLSDDPAVAAGRMEVEFLSHEVAKTGRVQVGARANDAVTGETTQLPGHIGQDVHWKGKPDNSLTIISIFHPYFKPHTTPSLLTFPSSPH